MLPLVGGNGAGGLFRDSSDQRLWHALYQAEHIHELPIAYNANAQANMSQQSWASVYLLHDIITQRSRGYAHTPQLHRLVRELSVSARARIHGVR